MAEPATYRTHWVLAISLAVGVAAWWTLGALFYGDPDSAGSAPPLLQPIVNDRTGLIRAQLGLFFGLLAYGALQLLGVAIERSVAERSVEVQSRWYWRSLANATGLSSSYLSVLGDSRGGKGSEAMAELLEQHRTARISWLLYGSWVLPISGFIGTVLGIRKAIQPLDEFGDAGVEPQALSAALEEVVSGLELAFDTTLVGLVSVVPVVLIQVVLRLQLERLRYEMAAGVSGGSVATPGVVG